MQHCEHGGECFYNTLTVYTNTGALAAVYHKYNLWTSELDTYGTLKIKPFKKSPTSHVFQTSTWPPASSP